MANNIGLLSLNITTQFECYLMGFGTDRVAIEVRLSRRYVGRWVPVHSIFSINNFNRNFKIG